MAFTVVRYSTEQYGEHAGVATTWLQRLAQPLLAAAADNGATAAPPQRLPRVPIFLRRGGAFGPPSSLATPMLMIGPGTGVTPFRGFLQHRRALLAAAAAAGEGVDAAARGAAVLYFGCRREDQDYLYRQDLEVRRWYRLWLRGARCQFCRLLLHAYAPIPCLTLYLHHYPAAPAPPSLFLSPTTAHPPPAYCRPSWLMAPWTDWRSRSRGPRPTRCTCST